MKPIFTRPVSTRRLCATILRATILTFAASAFGTQSAHAQKSSPSPDTNTAPVYELPKYTVSAQRMLPEPEHWRHTVAGGFEILSNASDSETQKFFRDIRQYLNVVNSIAPGVRPQTHSPIKLILCGERGSFEKLTGTIGAPVVASQWNDQVVFAVNLSSDFMIPINSGASDADDIQAYIENRLYKNYIDLSLEQFNPRLPAWFEHAVRSLFADMKFNGREVTFAEMRDGIWTTIAPSSTILRDTDPQRSPRDTRDLGEQNAGMFGEEPDGFSDIAGIAPADDMDSAAADASDNPFADGNQGTSTTPATQQQQRGIVQRRNAIMRMPLFLNYRPGVTTGLPNTFNAGTWARQCIIFVHYWLYRRTSTPEEKAAFAKFIQAATQGPMDEKTFKACLGLSYRDMEMAIAGYLDYTDYKIPVYIFKDDTRPPPLELRNATPAEIGRIKGESMISFGKSDEGYNELLAPYLRKKGDTQLNAALGSYEYNRGSLVRARPLLEIAVRENCRRPDACLALAELRLDEILKDKPDDHRLTPQQLDLVIAPILAAREIAEPSLQAYVTLANALRISAAPPSKGQAQMVLQGVNRHPTHPGLTFLAANVMLRGGFDDQARRLIERGLSQPGQQDDWRRWLEQASALLAKKQTPATDGESHQH
jgi:hypothetical protein